MGSSRARWSCSFEDKYCVPVGEEHEGGGVCEHGLCVEKLANCQLDVASKASRKHWCSIASVWQDVKDIATILAWASSYE